MKNKKENVKVSEPNKLVYFSDFNRLLVDETEETIEDLVGYQFCCDCASTGNDETCECIKRKERRDGTKEWFMSVGQLFLDDACEKIMAMANKIVEALKEKSFVCECPPQNKEEEADKN